MDITLKRILSLIPKKENGDYQHGAQKAFANSIGLKSGNLITDWSKGRSVSYKNYLYEISAKYNVSVEWLPGETDDPSAGIKKYPIPKDEAVSPAAQEILDFLDSASGEELADAIKYIRYLKSQRG